MSLTGKIAFITGGGRGIGKGCALALARAGADVALTYRRDNEAAQQTVAEIEKLGQTALALQCDVSEEEQVESAAKHAIEKLGGVDILVANAGIASRGSTVRDTPSGEFLALFNTHVMGAIWSTKAVLDSMRERGAGYIILITSVATKQHGANSAPYSMAKAAMESLMLVLSREEGPNGVRVNAIAPGLIETEMGRRLSAAHGSDIKDLYSVHPFGRVGQPEDIGNLAAFLCSEEGSYISGQVIYVDGGGFIRSS